MSPQKKYSIKCIGIDIAKNLFQIHGVDSLGRTCLRKQVTRKKLIEFMVQQPQCLVGMESCCGSHYWAKEFNKLGHDTRLMAAHRVKPFTISRNKSDRIDAEAICEAVRRPNMIFVEIKSARQLDIQALHRTRQRLIKLSTALSNQIRGLLLEDGIAIPKGISHIAKNIPEILENAERNLSTLKRDVISNLYTQFKNTRESLTETDKTVARICNSQEECKRIIQIPGIGPIGSTALFAAIGNGKQFKNGRHAAAWLGIVPRHFGTGGKTRQGSMSKMGNRYLKSIIIQGAKSLIIASRKKTDTYSVFISDLEKRKGANIAAVAMANKNIRTAWVLLAKKMEYVNQK